MPDDFNQKPYDFSKSRKVTGETEESLLAKGYKKQVAPDGTTHFVMRSSGSTPPSQKPPIKTPTSTTGVPTVKKAPSSTPRSAPPYKKPVTSINNEDIVHFESPPTTPPKKAPVSLPLDRENTLARQDVTHNYSMPGIKSYNYPDKNANYSNSTTRHFYTDPITKVEREVDPTKTSWDNKGNVVPGYMYGANDERGMPSYGTLRQLNTTSNGNIKNENDIVSTKNATGNISGTGGGGIVPVTTQLNASSSNNPNASVTQNGAVNYSNNPNLLLNKSDQNIGVGLVPQKANGGPIKKAPKSKGYDNGGTVQYDSYGNPINTDKSYQQQQLLNNGSAAAVSSGANILSQQGGKMGKIGGSFGWLGAATGAKDFAQSQFKSRDNTGYLKDKDERAANELITPDHEHIMKDINDKNYLALGLDSMGIGKFARAGSALFGSDKDDNAFNNAIGANTDYQNSQNINNKIKADIQQAKNKQKFQTQLGQQLQERGGYKNGTGLTGVIKGKGGPKDDAISAKVKEGSFVVPEENSLVGKMIIKSLLNKDPNKKANLKQGGNAADVNLSNGELLISPNDKKKIINKVGEETLEALAPNADENEANEKAKGGLTAKKAKVILHDKEIRGHAITDKQRKFFGAIASGETPYKAEGGSIHINPENIGKFTTTKERTGKTTEELTHSSNPLTKKRAIFAQNFGGKKDGGTMGYADGTDSDGVFPLEDRIKARQEKLRKQEMQSRGNKPGSTSTAVPTTTKKAPNVKNKQNSNNKFIEDNKEYPMVPGAKNETNYGDPTDPRFKDKHPLTPEGAQIFNDTVTKGAKEYNAEKPKKGSRIWDKIGNLGEYGAAAAQIGIGLNQLNNTKRPIYSIDPDFQTALNNANQAAAQAKEQSKYGFSPTQQFAIDQQNQNLTNAERFAARNYSGGSAANAYNMERDAINEGFNRNLNSKIASNAYQMEKQNIANQRQQYANQLLGSKIDMQRAIFQDALNSFNQKTQSASGLVNTGLSNLIGAKRYQDELNFQQDQANKYNPYSI